MLRIHHLLSSPATLPGRRRSRLPPARSSLLPFPPEAAAFHSELAAGVHAVERACLLCVDVKKSLVSSGDRRIIEKNDQTPVTVADFGVQALISWELKNLFPSIPLVAEEDSTFLRSISKDHLESDFLTDAVVNVVSEKVGSCDFKLAREDVLGAIDRGGKNAVSFDTEPATYWVLDPIDGTKGFLRGAEALYVVGLALIVDGVLVAGVMGCPNWKDNNLSGIQNDNTNSMLGIGTIMVSHAGCGTWTRSTFQELGCLTAEHNIWKRCFVDRFSMVHKAIYCIPDSQTWDMIPLSATFDCTSDDAGPQNEMEVYLLPRCCGSLAKYLTVASGRASAFVMRKRVTTTIKAWDHAAGVICVLEAGGRVTDWSGRPLDFAADILERRVIYPTAGVLATNGLLHDVLVDMITSNSST